MQDRIRLVRKALGLTQTEFGERLGIKGNTVTGYESGIRTPSDAMLISICREFNVNETWLRTGEGDMFLQRSRDEELAAFFGDALSGEPDFRRRFLAVLSRLSAEEWELLERMADRLVDEAAKEKEGQE